ncbi:hypothetical protein [Haloarcula nitratireducens]|uniref:Uncharacterized protein n=1 Tax=Haloarcula nitratireducens TaxID=2487749 RepID=A0AAW4P8R6_9EURY|nr:hypothetical protein [Halomicroarcula nitratireducens]MBX0294259.1 hypothetical protein [Halomicroarcula nitratireducens]
MQRLARLAGYATLLVTPAALLGRSIAVPTDSSVAVLGLGGGVALAGGVAAAVEYDDALTGSKTPTAEYTDATSVAVVAAAAAVTSLLSVDAGLGPVVASALVGAVTGVGVPDVDTAAYCGSFVGMASPAVFPAVEFVLLAGALAGLAFVAAKETFAGLGGKLGTLALFGCVTTGLLPGVAFGPGAPPQWGNLAFTVPVAVGSAVLTIALSERLDLGPVLASSLVGLAAGLVAPVAFPDVGDLVATVAFCSSFVGMSTTERVESAGGAGLAGALCGVVFVAVAPAFGGAGGKLGTVAFVACLSVFGAGELRNALVPHAP